MKLLALFLGCAMAFMPEPTHMCHEEFGPEIAKRSRAYPDPLPAGVGIFETTKKMNTGIKLIMSDEYTDDHNGMTHIWFQQIVKNLPVQNAVGNLNIHYSGKIISNYDRFTHKTDVEDPVPTIPADQAFLGLTKFVGNECKNAVTITKTEEEGTYVEMEAGDYSHDKITAKLEWLQKEDNTLELIWQVNVDLMDCWYDASVSAVTGEVLQLDDFVDWFTYNMYPLGVMDPEDGQRALVNEHVDPQYAPYGWHDLGNGVSYRTTRGNNVNAQENWSGTTPWVNNYRPTASAGDAFNFPINLAQDPRQYIDAAITNLFVANNYIHDIFYQYGFNEISGNFQANNFGRGGAQNDAVTAHCQDGSGFNNANFATPSDGNPGRMRMYVWNGWNPNKDGDLDNGIIYHEYAHGISNRLTGGPSATGCLSGGQSGGMGEGWGDFFGFMFRMRPEYNRNMTFGTGTYVTSGITIRNWPYSSNRQVAPQLYTNVPGLPIHQIGCVWCTILYEVFWNFVDVHGFDPDWYFGSGGNNRVIQIVTDGMKFQPCRPLLVDARDAILDSARVNYGDDDWCLAWDGFASRGLGVGAPTNAGSNSFTVPAECNDRLKRLLHK